MWHMRHLHRVLHVPQPLTAVCLMPVSQKYFSLGKLEAWCNLKDSSSAGEHNAGAVKAAFVGRWCLCGIHFVVHVSAQHNCLLSLRPAILAGLMQLQSLATGA